MLAAFFALTLAFVGIGLVWLSQHVGGKPLGYIGFVVMAAGFVLALCDNGADAGAR